MGYHLSLIFAFLSLVLQVSHGALPAPQLYWNSVLPSTQMPKSISELLQPDVSDVGKGKPLEHKGKPVHTGVGTQLRIPFFYRAYEHVTENQLHHQYPNISVYFLEKDMRQGTTMNLYFPANTNTATFLSRKSAESIPFSSTKLPEILLKLSAKANSADAKAIEQTIKECETPGIKGEEIHCATSLESMIDFSTAKLGTRNVQAISTEVVEKGTTISMHKYTTMPGVKKLAGDEAVVCHKQSYPYAVFYCHTTKPTRAYVVTLKGDDGVKANAVAICHVDTSEWNPMHLAFQMLKVKPGTVPVCHFLPNDHVVWVPSH